MKKIIAALGILATLAMAAPAMAQSVVPTYSGYATGYAAPYSTASSYAQPFCPSLSYNLYFGLRDYYTQGQVSALQQYLSTLGYNQPVTGFFGGVTRNNVAQYQRTYGIYPITGGVGPITRSVIAQRCGGYVPSTGSFSITNISGPNTINVGQTGTWSITTNAPYGSYLTTSVRWGDEGYYPYLANAGSARTQTSFSHTYQQAGTYTITFTVTDQYGHSTSASQTVSVGGGSAYQTPVITSITPNQGPVGTTVTIQGYGFSQNNTVYFGNGGTQNVPSYNGTSISYTIPSSIGAVCAAGQLCPQYLQLVTPGTYNISVGNGYSQSSSVPFVVTSTGTVGGLTVTSPTAGQTYNRGQDMTITWSYPVTPGSTQVMMELYSASGTRIGLIAVSNQTSGSYTWHIPGFPQNYMCTMQYPNGLCGTNIPDGQYYIKVSASNNPLDSNPTIIASGQSGTFTMTGAGTTNSLSASPTSGNAPLTVTFTPSSNPSGYFAIQFGDGTSANMLTSSVSHTYYNRGTYTASATTDLACLHSTPQCYTFAAQQSLGSVTVAVY